MPTVSVCETFVSIQGESTYAGLPCFFIRLAGCNLHCRYCDTNQAGEPGTTVEVEALAAGAAAARAALVEVTGGEPLLQAAFPELARRLVAESGKTVLVETNGSLDLSRIPDGVVAIVDVKCPGSGEAGSFDMDNLRRLRASDEMKFVLTDRADYEWARGFVEAHGLPGRCHAVLFSPACGGLDPAALARWVLDDGLPVRVQVQLHKVLGMR